MRYVFLLFFFSCIFISSVHAQVQDTVQFKMVYDSTRPHYVVIRDTSHIGDIKAFVAVRIGFWFGGDAGADFSSTESGMNAGRNISVSHVSGFGADLHYTGWLGNNFYWDMSLSCWYIRNDTTVHITLSDQTIRDSARTTWSVIVPLTFGVSYYFPTQIILKPYVQAGLGVYGAYNGYTEEATTENFENLHFTNQKLMFILGGYIGAGAKLAITPTFGLDLSLKYTLGKYSDPLYTGVQNISGLQTTFGIALILPFQPKY